MKHGVELDAVARAVIDAGRDGFEPTELNRARVKRAVDLKLAAGAAVGTAALAHAKPAFAGAVKVATSLAAAGAVATGAAMLVLPRAPLHETRSTHSAVPAAPPPASSRYFRAESAPGAVSLATSSSAPPAQAPATAATAPRTRSTGLADEIELLARANAAINAGDGDRALRLLAEYDREHRRGYLGEERSAAGVLALCAAGRTAAARAAAERFQRRWPKSPLLSRIARSCAAAR